MFGTIEEIGEETKNHFAVYDEQDNRDSDEQDNDNRNDNPNGNTSISIYRSSWRG